MQLTLQQHGFPCASPLTHRLFFSNKYYSTTWSLFGWIWGYRTSDKEEACIWWNLEYEGTNINWIFDCLECWHHYPFHCSRINCILIVTVYTDKCLQKIHFSSSLGKKKFSSFLLITMNPGMNLGIFFFNFTFMMYSWNTRNCMH